MTLVGLEYLKHQENKRANLANEDIQRDKLSHSYYDTNLRAETASLDRYSRETIAANERLLRSAESARERQHQLALANTNNVSREKIAQLDRDSHEIIANRQMDSNELIASNKLDLESELGWYNAYANEEQKRQDRFSREAIAEYQEQQANYRAGLQGLGNLASAFVKVFPSVI